MKLSRRSLVTGAAALTAYQWLRPREADARFVVNQLTGFGVSSAAVEPIPPDQIANLYAWYRADTVVGNPVTSWTDQGPNTLHLTGGSGPAVVSSDPVFGNQDSLSFDHTVPNTLANSSFAPGAVSHWFVAMLVTSGNNQGIVICRTQTPHDVPYIANVIGTDSDQRINAGMGNLASSSNVPYGTAFLVAGHFDNSNSHIEVNRDGQIAGTIGTAQFSGMQVGNYTTTSGFEFSGKVAEVVTYSAEITGANLLGLQEYFRQRYSLF